MNYITRKDFIKIENNKGDCIPSLYCGDNAHSYEIKRKVVTRWCKKQKEYITENRWDVSVDNILVRDCWRESSAIRLVRKLMYQNKEEANNSKNTLF